MRNAFSKGEARALHYFRQIEMHRSLQVRKKSDASPVTIADTETEEIIRSQIHEAFPKDSILGEEMGQSVYRENTAEAQDDKDSARKNRRAALWIIDPIDGTRGFIAGFPLFGILLARLDENGALQASAVSMPALGCRRFFATRQGEAWQEDNKSNRIAKLKTSGCQELVQARLCIGEAERTLLPPHVAGTRALQEKVASYRYEHDCYMYLRLAAGGIDMLIEAGLQPYDFMPLVLIIQKAGGVISDWQGEDLTIKSKGQVLACASPELHQQAVAQIAATCQK